jgi:uncharacterized membrane-anchored protein
MGRASPDGTCAGIDRLNFSAMNRTIVIIIAGALLVLAAVNAAIFRAESGIRAGRTIYLKHAPVDPRSMMQGDYMILNYEVNRDAKVREALQDKPARGTLVMKLDHRNIATFARRDDEEIELAENEIRLRYRRKRWGVATAPESFFFQEGQAQRYDWARFSELKVSPDGAAILTSLTDENLVPLGESGDPSVAADLFDFVGTWVCAQEGGDSFVRNIGKDSFIDFNGNRGTWEIRDDMGAASEGDGERLLVIDLRFRNGSERLTVNPEQPDELTGRRSVNERPVVWRRVASERSGDETAPDPGAAKESFDFTGVWLCSHSGGSNWKGVRTVFADHFLDPNGKRHQWKMDGNRIDAYWNGELGETLSVDLKNPDVLEGTRQRDGKAVVWKRVNL